MGGKGMERVQTQFLICRKSGCSLAPLASFLPILVCVGLCWARSWDHTGLILDHFGLCWGILGYVGTILGSC